MTWQEYMKTDQYKEEHDNQTLKEMKDILRGMVNNRQEVNFYKAKAEWERARVYKAWKGNPERREELAYTKYWRR